MSESKSMSMSMSAAERLHARLAGELAEDRFVTDPDRLAETYGADYTEEPPREPGLAVCPHSAEEVQAVVRAADAEGASITVRVSGSNVGGLALPPEGGVVIDLLAMNRILEVDEENMYALIEPGVTWEQLKAHLEQRQIPLRMGYPLSPPDTSIVANCLLDGLGNLSMRHGAMGDWIGGLEAVLPDGELIRTGAGALSDRWFGRGPLPDLTGLFVCFQGTTGVVTKMAFQLWPQPPCRRRAFVLMYDRDVAFQLMRDLCRLQICDDVGGLSWPTGKMLFGVDHPAERDPNEPEFFVYLDIGGQTPLEIELKMAILDQHLDGMRRKGAELERPVDIKTLVRLNPRFGKFAEFPTRLEFLVDAPGGGLTWVGTYGPMSRFEQYAARGVEITARYGKPPIIVSRPMKGGHFGVMRFIATFDKQDQSQRDAVRKMNDELVTAGLDLGFIPYKTPPWVVAKHVAPRLDPSFKRVMKGVRQLLDPKGLMAPRSWPLDAD